ncbi:ORF3 [Human lung-associated vientovirus AL]|uniref:ORF3 n=1 Tax=Human lung-associated vientovirus AL TaxID=2571079 RepID=A0A4D6K3B2_9VIRU|nr:ORF3 [Human lung-associated vientovirus AL]
MLSPFCLLHNYIWLSDMHQEREFIVEKRGNLLEGFVDIVLRHVRQLNVITGLRGLLGIIQRLRRLEGLKGNTRLCLVKVLRINCPSSQYRNLFNCLIMMLLGPLLYYMQVLSLLVILHLLKMILTGLKILLRLLLEKWEQYFLRRCLLLLILLLLELIRIFLLVCMAIIPFLLRLLVVKKCKFMLRFILSSSMLGLKFHGIQGIKQFHHTFQLNSK